jgi:CRISPR/Cas system-associated exonuclease Cas4 (RecB family)
MTPAVSGELVGSALADELVRRRKEALEGERKQYPQHSPRASNIHDCGRNIVYQVLDWEKQAKWDDYMLARFAEGRRQEKAVIEELRNDGFEIIDRDENGQLTIAVPETNTADFRRGEVLTGNIDGLIKWGGKWIPFEVKSVNPNKYNKINTLDDFKKDPLYRRYLRQLTMYMYGKNAEEALYILTDCLGHRKYLPFTLDYEEGDWILKHLERAVRAIKAHQYPDRIPYNSNICDKCPFVAECIPDVCNQGAEIVDKPEYEAQLTRREELAPLVAEYEELDEEVKDTAKAVGKDMIVGGFSVILRKGQRTAYNIPDEIKKGFAEKVETVTVKIVKNEAKGKEAAA